MKTELTIKLNTIDEIKRFANKVTRLFADVDIIKGKTVYDAKSIMAIFSMGTLDGVCVKIHTEDENEIQTFNEFMNEFLI